MRINCKDNVTLGNVQLTYLRARQLQTECVEEYIRLYKKKFNGPQSTFAWRRSLPSLTAEDMAYAARLRDSAHD